MERYHPRAGLWCLIVALPSWMVFLFNGMLGFFPAIIFADGGMGQKFHFWLFIRDKLNLFGGSPDPVWSEAGVMTSQEWILLALALPATLGALYCLRRRPEFGAIQRNDDVSERESLEVGTVGLGFSGGGDMHTQSIVESVLGQEETLDQNVVSAALGEMGVIAAANAAEVAEQEELDLEPEMVHDSRYTTTILDEDTLDMVSTYANEEAEEEVVEETEEDDTGWSVWEPEMDSENQPEPETDSKVVRQLPEIPELFREPIQDTPDPLDIPSIPEIPSIETPRANLGERISNIATQAADATMNVTKDVVSATVSGAKEVASIAAGITEKVVDKVRQKSTKGVMPVRPAGLPPMAEWDAYQGAWTLMGRPVQVAATPEPETHMPDWSRTQNEPVSSQNEQPVQTNEVRESRRNTPFIPELP